MQEFLKNKDLLSLWENYDAYFIGNKYGEGTHEKEFKSLSELLPDEVSTKALSWIRHCYDCYYKNEYEDMNDSNPFWYLQNKLNNKKEGKENE